jgi:hypothetical protein
MKLVDITLHQPAHCHHKIHPDHLPSHLVESTRKAIRPQSLVGRQSFDGILDFVL